MQTPTDFIIESRFFEMAFDKKTIKSKIRGLETPLNQHILKILLFKDSLNQKKHIASIDNWFNQIQHLSYKQGSGKLSQKEYFTLLYDEPFGGLDIRLLDKYIRRVLYEYTDLPRSRLSLAEVVDVFHTIHIKVSLLLANDELERFSKQFKKELTR